MGRNLDLDNCPNKQETVIAAYVEELEENERKDCRRGLGDNSGPIEDNLLVPDFHEILHEPPAHSKLEAGTGEHEETEGPGGLLFLGLGLIFSWP